MLREEEPDDRDDEPELRLMPLRLLADEPELCRDRRADPEEPCGDRTVVRDEPAEGDLKIRDVELIGDEPRLRLDRTDTEEEEPDPEGVLRIREERAEEPAERDVEFNVLEGKPVVTDGERSVRDVAAVPLEGVRSVRTVELDGRSLMTLPVEPGLITRDSLDRTEPPPPLWRAGNSRSWRIVPVTPDDGRVLPGSRILRCDRLPPVAAFEPPWRMIRLPPPRAPAFGRSNPWEVPVFRMTFWRRVSGARRPAPPPKLRVTPRAAVPERTPRALFATSPSRTRFGLKSGCPLRSWPRPTRSSESRPR